MPSTRPVSVSVAYLESHKGFGDAQIACYYGCECAAVNVSAHTAAKHQVTRTAMLDVSQAEVCAIRVTIEPAAARDQRGRGDCFKTMYVKISVEQ